jgi:hypothetical protein
MPTQHEQCGTLVEAGAENAEFRGSCGHTFLETSTHAFPIFSCIFNGDFMFGLLPLFRCFPEVWRGRFGLFLCHSLCFWRWLFTLLGGG